MTRLCKQIVIGYTADGKQIRKRVYADGKRELESKIEQIRDEQKRVRHPSAITFKDYSDKWLKIYKTSRTDNTKAMYSYALSSCSDLNGIPIKDIKKTDLQAVIASHADHPRMCQVIRLTLRQVFSAAVDDGHIVSNPAAKLEIPKYRVKEKRSLTDEERKVIKEADLPERERLFLDILYYFGLRRGEALALRRTDFDFKSFFLHVHKSVAFNANRPQIKATKTQAERYVPIPKSISKDLKKRLPEDYLFTDKDGQLLTESQYHKMWKDIVSAIGLDIGAHHIRHDYATRLYYAPGISTKMKADILGHSEQLFLQRYSHIDSKKEALDKFQEGMTF